MSQNDDLGYDAQQEASQEAYAEMRERAYQAGRSSVFAQLDLGFYREYGTDVVEVEYRETYNEGNGQTVDHWWVWTNGALSPDTVCPKCGGDSWEPYECDLCGGKGKPR